MLVRQPSTNVKKAEENSPAVVRAKSCPLIAELLILSPRLDQSFSYACTQELVLCGALEEGALLRVPFGKQEVLAVVWRVQESEKECEQECEKEKGSDSLPDDRPPRRRLKSLTAAMRQSLPPLRADCRAFVQNFSAYTMTPRGKVLKSIFAPLFKAGRLASKKEVRAYRITERGKEQHLADKGDKKTQKKRLLGMLEKSASRSPEGLLHEDLLCEGISASVLRGCCKLGLVECALVEEVCRSSQTSASAALTSPLRVLPRAQPLSSEQQAAAYELRALYREGKFATVLLDGETGSGKTEVYFEAIAACLQAGRQVLLMLPEIALSLRFAERFHDRFGFAPSLYHSALSARERRAVWHKVAHGTTCAVLGARSALFLPFDNLGLVIVDEEHDHAYKQEEGIVYHARDMAVLRAQKAGCLVVLVSATPSLESWHNAERGKYRRIVLPHRFGSASLPKVTLVDLPKEASAQGTSEPLLTPTLRARIAETLSRKEQVLIFLNRRGYAPLLLCSRCGARLSCHNCSAFLVEHRASARVVCHHCNFSMPTPQHCPSCNAKGGGSLKAYGVGVERLAEALRGYFPKARLRILSSDTRDPQAVVHALEQRRCDLVVGTQMLAKGYHFPYLTLVGIVNADAGLQGGDLRAFERCYQLLHQVAGRAGRAEKKGEVVVQTTEPNSVVLHALKTFDRDKFLQHEIRARCNAERNIFWPPFARLATVVVSAKDKRRLETFVQSLHEDFPVSSDVECFGPAVPPLSPLRGRHRRRFLLRTREKALQPLLARWLARSKPADVRLKVDIDPYSFL